VGRPGSRKGQEGCSFRKGTRRGPTRVVRVVVVQIRKVNPRIHIERQKLESPNPNKLAIGFRPRDRSPARTTSSCLARKIITQPKNKRRLFNLPLNRSTIREPPRNASGRICVIKSFSPGGRGVDGRARRRIAS
jgi:hypothetical protein